MPEMFGEIMATFFANLMPLILLIWAAAYQTFVEEINNEFYKEFYVAHTEDVSQDGNDCLDKCDPSSVEQELYKKLSKEDNSNYIASIAVTCTFCCLLVPVRSYLHYITPNLPEQDDQPYNDVALTFSSDYDKENPLTMQ